MNLIDLHCDTLWKLMQSEKNGDLMDNLCSVSIPVMKKGGTLVQFFACFIYGKEMPGNTKEEKYENGYEYALLMIRYLKEQLSKYSGDISLGESMETIRCNEKKHKISAVLTIEEGGILNGRIERLNTLYEEGVRLFTPLWNYENCLGHPSCNDQSGMDKGLTEFGNEAVERMNELGMIVDISHASDQTARDIMRCSKKPVVASHSNCRSICAHPRNLPDELLRLLGEQGGVAGLNFYGSFLGKEGVSGIEEMIHHIKHMIRVGGSGLPAIGTDFDGFDDIEHMDVPNMGKMHRLWEAMEAAGFTEDQMEKIWYKNAWRVMNEVLVN